MQYLRSAGWRGIEIQGWQEPLLGVTKSRGQNRKKRNYFFSKENGHISQRSDDRYGRKKRKIWDYF